MDTPWAQSAATITNDLYRLAWWWLPRPSRSELAEFLGNGLAKVIKDTEKGPAKPPKDAHLVPVTLRDGRTAWLRPLLPTDREMHRESYAKLSDASKYHRFLSPVPQLSERLLDKLVDSVDGIDHIAYYLFIEDFDLPVGIARIVRDPRDYEVADVAVTVLDEYHGQGVATALLAFLVEHRPEGVTRIETLVSSDNPASLAMLRRLGPTTTETHSGVCEVRIDLGERPEETPEPAPESTDEDAVATIESESESESESDAAPTAAPPADPVPQSRLLPEFLQLDTLILDWLRQLVPNDLIPHAWIPHELLPCDDEAALPDDEDGDDDGGDESLKVGQPLP